MTTLATELAAAIEVARDAARMLVEARRNGDEPGVIDILTELSRRAEAQVGQWTS